MSELNDKKYFINLIDLDLLPKNNFQNVSVIIYIEKFAEIFFKQCFTNEDDPPINLIQLKKILFGLGCSTYSNEIILETLKNIATKNILDVNAVINELANEYDKVNQIIKQNDVKDSLRIITIDDFQKILNEYIGENFSKMTIDLSNFFTDNNVKKELKEFDSPDKIKNILDAYFVGSDEVKFTISRVFYEHILSKLSGKQILPKRNVLLVGPSGSGKSYLIRKLSEILNLPFVIYDSSKLTQRGYVGDKVEDILRILYQKTNSLEKMKGSVIFFDEIDKLAAGSFTTQGDVSTTGPQQDLLKFMEGDVYEFSNSPDKHSNKELKFNSSDLMIIAGGAFEGIEELIAKRNKQIGFSNSNIINYFEEVTVEDLAKYGLIKQLASRFQIITVLHKKSIENLIDILVNVKDSILNMYIDYFRFHNCELTFTNGGIRKIAEIALEQNTGARGLVKIIEQILPMYELGNRAITNLIVDEDYILKKIYNS